MALTKESRDALPADDFAVPGKRVLPIHDETHVKMAWDMVDRTRGLTDGERSEARKRIVSRAKKLGIDTKGWKIQAMSWIAPISAMSLEMPETPDHPNKMPFSGILVRLDEPSSAPPHGSFGLRTILTSAAAEAALPSLLGMAINYMPNLSGHDRKAKIGIIDAASIETDALGPYIHISGFMYASDFPDATAKIKKDKDDLGFSFEAERLYVGEDLVDGCLAIDKLTFTGAAVLWKRSAAYQSTSIAASAEQESLLEKEQYDALMGAITTLGGRVEKIEAGQVRQLAAASVLDKVKPHTDKLRGVADGMEAAGIGMHATRGHVHVLRKMADDMDAAACRGEMPSDYSGGMYSSRVDAAAVVTTDPAVTAEMTAIKTMLTDVGNQLKTLQASSAEGSPAPARKTIEPAIIRLLAKGSIVVPDGDGKMTVSSLDAALAKTTLTTEQRLQVKIGLNNAGILDQAA